MINWSSEVLLLTLAFSVGYFIYDAVDMYVNNPKTSTYQLLGHHFCVIVCFAIRYVKKTEDRLREIAAGGRIHAT